MPDGAKIVHHGRVWVCSDGSKLVSPVVGGHGYPSYAVCPLDRPVIGSKAYESAKSGRKPSLP